MLILPFTCLFAIASDCPRLGSLECCANRPNGSEMSPGILHSAYRQGGMVMGEAGGLLQPLHEERPTVLRVPPVLRGAENSDGGGEKRSD